MLVYIVIGLVLTLGTITVGLAISLQVRPTTPTVDPRIPAAQRLVFFPTPLQRLVYFPLHAPPFKRVIATLPASRVFGQVCVRTSSLTDTLCVGHWQQSHSLGAAGQSYLIFVLIQVVMLFKLRAATGGRTGLALT